MSGSNDCASDAERPVVSSKAERPPRPLPLGPLMLSSTPMDLSFVALLGAIAIAVVLLPVLRPRRGPPAAAGYRGAPPPPLHDEAALEAELARYRAALRAGTLCDRCRQANPAASRFCAECGRRLPAAAQYP